MADTSVKISFIGDAKKLKSTLDDVDKEIDNLGKNSKSFGSKFTDGFSKAIPVLAGVGAGVAVLGSALKAAAEDQAEQKKLAQTLMNVANATKEDIAATEVWIDTKQRATGVADSELRPALDVLLRGTKDLEWSTTLLNIAMDVSAGTGKDLETVSTALSQAYAGNMRGLQALSPEMKDLIKDGMTAQEAFDHLSATFKDQASVQAETMEGKMKRLNIAMDEAKETLGAKLMPVALAFTDWLIKDAVPWLETTAGKVGDWWAQQDELHRSLRDAGEELKNFIEDVKVVAGWMQTAYEWTKKFTDAVTGLPGGSVSGMDIWKKIPGADKSIIDLVPWGKKAAGGPVSAGKPYWVGEKGPEVMVPGASGSIIPNHRLGGGGVTVNVYVAGSVLSERDLVGVLNSAMRRGFVPGV